jgi:hypothetical protein
MSPTRKKHLVCYLRPEVVQKIADVCDRLDITRTRFIEACVLRSLEDSRVLAFCGLLPEYHTAIFNGVLTKIKPPPALDNSPTSDNTTLPKDTTPTRGTTKPRKTKRTTKRKKT